MIFPVALRFHSTGHVYQGHALTGTDAPGIYAAVHVAESPAIYQREAVVVVDPKIDDEELYQLHEAGYAVAFGLGAYSGLLK